MTDTAITPFRIDIPQAEIDELHGRLAATRWPDELPDAGWGHGVPLRRVRALADCWQSTYEWRRQEAELNAMPQFTTTIDGQTIHFAHVRSPEPSALPLILTHGWPGSFAEFLALAGPLSDSRSHGGDPRDAFDLVIPSLPGFGFSGPTRVAWDASSIAELWAQLMARLGYSRYGAQGGDFGALISPALARADPDHVVGVHVNALVTLPSGDPDELTEPTAEELGRLDGLRRWHEERSGYAAIQSTRPQTLAYALTDSPAGQLAWNVEWFDAYGDAEAAIDADRILTQVSIYWLTRTAGSAARLYKGAAAAWSQAPRPSSVPVGVAVFPGDSSIRRLAERVHPIARWSEFDRGGHFAALQAPDLLLADVRAFFAELR